VNILHLVNDEKFIHFIADVFNSCEGTTNQFLVMTNPALPLKYVMGLKNMRVIDRQYIQSGNIRNDLAECDALVVHYLDIQKAAAILQTPKDIPIIWSGWGGDYYDLLPFAQNNLLGSATARLQSKLARKSPISKRLKDSVKNMVKQAVYGRVIAKAIRRVDYFSAPIPEDYDLIRNELNLAAEYYQLNYASVENTFKLGPQEVRGANILVGNSASATNNHLEIFQLLSKIDLKDRKIVVPLSYGDSVYRDAVIENGRELFGQSFHPIVDFVPLEQYNAMMAQCSVVVMGHRRQQAIGNMATMLYKDAKVFLDEETTTFRFFQKRGAFIYGLSELVEGKHQAFEPLSDEQKHKNRTVVEAFWGQGMVLSNARHLIETMRTHRKLISA
jgi:ABC-type phosphate transport system auxiliary subunit